MPPLGWRIPLSQRRVFHIGMMTVAALVLLRVGIGWHFLYEGLWKVKAVPAFSSEPYWRAAKGPLAPLYHQFMLPDLYGEQRLDFETMSARWKSLYEQFSEKYKLSPEQQTSAEKALSLRTKQLQGFLDANLETYTTADADGNSVERTVYFADLEKLRRAQDDAEVQEVPYGRKRTWEQHRALISQSAGWIDQVESIEDSYYEDLRSLLDSSQVARGAWNEPPNLLARLDQIVAWFVVAIGACLIAGLFTRAAAFGGGVFLISLIGAQPEWPTIYPSAPPSSGHALLVNKEFVEMLALFTLATTRVGRWGGLDFFVHYMLVRPFFGRGK